MKSEGDAHAKETPFAEGAVTLIGIEPCHHPVRYCLELIEKERWMDEDALYYEVWINAYDSSYTGSDDAGFEAIMFEIQLTPRQLSELARPATRIEVLKDLEQRVARKAVITIEAHDDIVHFTCDFGDLVLRKKEELSWVEGFFKKLSDQGE